MPSLSSIRTCSHCFVKNGISEFDSRAQDGLDVASDTPGSHPWQSCSKCEPWSQFTAVSWLLWWSLFMTHSSPKSRMRGCLALAKAHQADCKVDQTTQAMGKGEEGEVVLFACLLSHESSNWMFGVSLQVNLKQSRKYFWGVHPKAAKCVNTAREMHLMDLLCYHHRNELACINTSQSLSCVPFVKCHNQPLPCLTCGTKALFSFIEYYAGQLGLWCLLVLTCWPPPRPHGKFLVLSKDDDDKSRYLLGREIMGLMGIPINRLVGLDDTSESAFCLKQYGLSKWPHEVHITFGGSATII